MAKSLKQKQPTIGSSYAYHFPKKRPSKKITREKAVYELMDDVLDKFVTSISEELYKRIVGIVMQDVEVGFYHGGLISVTHPWLQCDLHTEKSFDFSLSHLACHLLYDDEEGQEIEKIIEEVERALFILKKKRAIYDPKRTGGDHDGQG